MQRKQRVEGIVIRRRDVGEADRLLTVLTKERGKIQIKANGVRKVPSRRGPHVELLNRCELSLYLSGKVPSLIAAETLDDYREVKENLASVGSAYHLCEIVNGLCPENEPLPHVFTLLLDTLNAISDGKEISFTIHQFEIQLLTILGFWHASQDNSQEIDTEKLIEGLLERKLKSRRVFEKI